jgi:hypothetical protein
MLIPLIMRIGRRSAIRSLALAPVCWLVAAGAFAGEAVLLSSTAPGYAPGMVVAANERFTVPEGASTTLLFQSGEMLRLRGPFDGPLHPTEVRNASKGSIAGLAEALRLQGIDAAVVGGTRAIGALSRSRVVDSDLVVDARRSATYCIERSTSIWIGRPDEAVDRIGLRRRGGSREIAWPVGAARAEWPADVPVDVCDRLEILDPEGTARAIVSFHLMEER